MDAVQQRWKPGSPLAQPGFPAESYNLDFPVEDLGFLPSCRHTSKEYMATNAVPSHGPALLCGVLGEISCFGPIGLCVLGPEGVGPR